MRRVKKCVWLVLVVGLVIANLGLAAASYADVQASSVEICLRDDCKCLGDFDPVCTNDPMGSGKECTYQTDC